MVEAAQRGAALGEVGAAVLCRGHILDSACEDVGLVLSPLVVGTLGPEGPCERLVIQA